MKKTIKLAIATALALSTTAAYATNGSTMLAVGVKARGMGGVGIGMSHGSESVLSNPALITNVQSTEISFGGTLFMPDVENTNTWNAAATAQTATSDADQFVIPSVSLVTKVNDNFYTGVGLWGTGGLGVDYRKTPVATGNSQMQMVTSLQIMQFGVPLVYTEDSFSIGITPLLQYGVLDINYNSTGTNSVGAGVGSDLSFGYNLGLSYSIDDITIGAIYKSKISMSYDGQLPAALKGFGIAAYTNDGLDTPSELGIGLSYKLGEHTFAVDYKNIQWSDAKGYQDFGWEDQDVVSLGYEYSAGGWAARLGYSKANSAVKDNKGKTLPQAAIGLNAAVANTFNALGFPGNIEEHYTAGMTYDFTDMVSLDLAYVYAPEQKLSITNAYGQPMSFKHSETSYSAAINLAF